MILQLFLQNPLVGVLLFVAIILAIGLHEAAHAYAANFLGDDTPRIQGRLTLNPLSHLDPWGTFLIVLAGIGWGRAVQFNPYNLKNPRRDTMLIALAGPLTNFVLAVVTALFLRLTGELPIVSLFLQNFLFLNIALGVFNLMPIDPLDGFKVVAGLLPAHLAYQWEETRRYGLIILIALLFTGALGRIVFPIVEAISNLLV